MRKGCYVDTCFLLKTMPQREAGKMFQSGFLNENKSTLFIIDDVSRKRNNGTKLKG